MKVRINRKAHFNAAHRLYNPSWDDDHNRRVFGKCSNPFYHGHNYELIISLTGEIQSDTGFVADLGWLAQLIKTEVEDRLDHKNLNEEVVEFQKLNPTAENIAVVIHGYLQPHIPQGLELKVTLYETPRNFVEYPVD